jgi:hypothetical protein
MFLFVGCCVRATDMHAHAIQHLSFSTGEVLLSLLRRTDLLSAVPSSSSSSSLSLSLVENERRSNSPIMAYFFF